jgi:hypothetical protein
MMIGTTEIPAATRFGLIVERVPARKTGGLYKIKCHHVEAVL